MKNLNLNLNTRLTDANNITISSQKALKTYIDSKRILLDFLQDSAPTTFQTGNKWLNTSNLKLYTATSSSNWDSGISITTNELYTFDNVLYHYDGTNLSIYSTDSIKEQNSGNETKIWIGTQSEYDNLDSYDNNTIYNIIDTTSVVSALLATQQEFNNSAQNRAATPYQVNQALGNYMPLAGGNFDTGAVVRFTNGNGTNSISYDSSNVLNITNNVSVGNNLTANAIVATSGNIYKTNTSGDTVVWSSTLNNYLPLTGGTLTGDLNFNKSGAHNATISTNNHALTISVGSASLGVSESDGYGGLFYNNGTISRYPVYTDTKAVANGVATLDSNTKVPTTQLPLATNSTVGVVQGDGTTTSVDANGVISVIGGGGGTSDYHPPLLSSIWSDHLLNDIQWLRADTFSWQSGAVYEAVYNLLEDEYDQGTPESAQISNPSWNSGTLPVNGTWFAAASSNITIAVLQATSGSSSSNIGARSTDGINWTQFTMPSTQSWNAITYGNGTFVVVTSSNVVAYSTDNGLTWNTSTLPSSATWYDVTYGNGTFVAIANNSNKAAYSTDGINWNSATLSASTYWNKIAYGNGTFVAVGFAGSSAISYSTDNGATWTSASAPLSNCNINSIVYANNKFVAMVYHNNGRYLWISTDGINWTSNSINFYYVQGAIGYGDGVYVLSGYDIMSSTGSFIAQSTDLVNWTTLYSSLTFYVSQISYCQRRLMILPSLLSGGSASDITYYYSTRTLIDVIRTPSGLLIATEDQESEVNTLYNSIGVAWYYILDTINQRFKLPRTKFGFTGLRTNPGDYIAESLPDHRHKIADQSGTNGNNYMADSNYMAAGLANNTQGEKYSYGVYNNSTYQNNAPVQERATQMYLYFYVGNFSQSATEQTAGLNSELFNGKIDLDGSNATFPYIVETYHNGTDWYRVWSDGWCEQGGRFYNNASVANTISLYKQFLNTDYMVIVDRGINGTYNNNINGQHAGEPYDFTTTSFKVNTYASVGLNTIQWRACGYIS